MSNLPILYFTLGALVGLPAGYWLGWICDPTKVVCIAYSFVFHLSSVDDEMEKLRRAFVLNGINPKGAT